MAGVDPSELAGIPLFASLSAADLAEVARSFEAKEVGPGARLAGEGATGSSFFVLHRGRASVTASGQEIAALAEGDFFGEIALLGHGRRTATVTTTTPARVLVLFRDEFQALRATLPAVAAEIEAAAQARLGGP